jgi:hypothetical protein
MIFRILCGCTEGQRAILHTYSGPELLAMLKKLSSIQLMKHILPGLLTFAIWASLPAQAQTISSFDDLTLPGAETSYEQTLSGPQSYQFQSGNVSYFGNLESWGGFSGFNFTNITDTIDGSYLNDKASITGSGRNGSANYAVAYAFADWMVSLTESIEIGLKLNGAAAGSKVPGFYVTNSTWVYHYIRDNYTEGNWFQLVVRGYQNNMRVQDSVVVTLASVTANDTVLIKDWEWVNLMPLGDVDSLTFQVRSNDEFTPFYFVMDDLITLDNACPIPVNIAATSISETSATISWNNMVPNFSADYEISIDESATLEPGTISGTHIVSDNSYQENGLQPGVTYYAHLRTRCEGGGTSNWDTASFQTMTEVSISGFNSKPGKFSISPNPATDYLNIDAAKGLNIAVFNLEGKMVLQARNSTKINIAHLPAGLYHIIASDTAAGTSFSARFSKLNP